MVVGLSVGGGNGTDLRGNADLISSWFVGWRRSIDRIFQTLYNKSPYLI